MTTEAIASLPTPTVASPAAPTVAPASPSPAPELGPAFVHGLRCAVALQAEALLRSVGVMAANPGTALDGGSWLEREARDLGALAIAAVAGGAGLPAGMDNGAAEGADQREVLDGLLAARRAVADTVRDLLTACSGSEAHAWMSRILAGILQRREEEILMLRGLGASGRLPQEQVYVRGSLPGA